MLVQQAKARLVTTVDVEEGVLEPADGQQEGNARRRALGVGGVLSFQQPLERLRAAERADDREVEVAVPAASTSRARASWPSVSPPC
jgi:hypothetical protein